MTIQEVLESKTFVNESNNITFGSPKDYIAPFVDIVGEEDLNIVGSDRVINKNEDGSENISYARIRIEKLYGDTKLESIGIFRPVVGLIYALDVSKPVIKVYTGLNASACNNLNVFNAEHIFQMDLLSNYKVVYGYADSYAKTIESLITDYFKKIDIMNNKRLSFDEYREVIGELLRRSVKDNTLGTTPVVKAVKLLEDKQSNYYFHRENNNTLWNIYNASTDYISQSPEYKEHPNKSLKMFNLLMENYNE